MNKVNSIFFGLWSLLFLISAYLQLNDEDPWVWVSIYLVAAVLSALAAIKNYPLVPLAVGAVLCFFGFVYYYPSSVSDWIAQEWQQQDLTMKTTAMEEARESFGFLLIALVLLAAFIVGLRRKKRSKHNYGRNYLT